jgi:hypothetical protein
MRSEMAEWRMKMHATGERTEAEAHDASADAKAHLDRTWSATERASRKLQAESAEGPPRGPGLTRCWYRPARLTDGRRCRDCSPAAALALSRPPITVPWAPV